MQTHVLVRPRTCAHIRVGCLRVCLRRSRVCLCCSRVCSRVRLFVRSCCLLANKGSFFENKVLFLKNVALFVRKQVARTNERHARTNERHARTNERHARTNKRTSERRAQTCATICMCVTGAWLRYVVMCADVTAFEEWSIDCLLCPVSLTAFCPMVTLCYHASTIAWATSGQCVGFLVSLRFGSANSQCNKLPTSNLY